MWRNLIGDVKNTNVGAKDEHGFTLLRQACWEGRLDIAKFLISHGANVDAKDEHGFTLLRQACWEGRLDIAKFLISHDANVDAKDEHGFTLLRQAFGERRLDIAEFLVSHGALDYVFKYKDLKDMNLLLEYTANLGIYSSIKDLDIICNLYSKTAKNIETELYAISKLPKIDYLLNEYKCTAKKYGFYAGDFKQLLCNYREIFLNQVVKFLIKRRDYFILHNADQPSTESKDLQKLAKKRKIDIPQEALHSAGKKNKFFCQTFSENTLTFTSEGMNR